MPGTVLRDTNVFTAWLKPRSTLVPLYGRHVFGRRTAIAQQTVAEARYGAMVAGWGDKRLDNLDRLIHRSAILPSDDETTWAYARLGCPGVEILTELSAQVEPLSPMSAANPKRLSNRPSIDPQPSGRRHNPPHPICTCWPRLPACSMDEPPELPAQLG
jgi:hypothetical protein